MGIEKPRQPHPDMLEILEGIVQVLEQPPPPPPPPPIGGDPNQAISLTAPSGREHVVLVREVVRLEELKNGDTKVRLSDGSGITVIESISDVLALF
ncbi:MAG: hypothetical protein V3S55_15500 [Nitrospiraceae bacterium]